MFRDKIEKNRVKKALKAKTNSKKKIIIRITKIDRNTT
jgi:hypothetical protein